MNSEIITVGSELLSGRQLNTNAKYLSDKLMSIGIDIDYHISVKDNRNAIKKAVSDALSRSNVVILTGGLGPTDDDMTKEAVCELLSIELVEDEQSKRKIELFFLQKGIKIPQNNYKQALVPEGAIVLRNEHGHAPGAILKSGNQCIIILPGPPSEMEPMFEKDVKPFLKSISDKFIVSKTVNVFGMGESLIAQQLDDLIKKEKPVVATYASVGQTDVTIMSDNADVSMAVKEVDSTEEEIIRRLGDCVYGTNSPSIQHTVISELITKNITLSVAESCTGGLIAKKITDTPGSSLVFGFGVTTYSESMKHFTLGVNPETINEYGVVSAETAAQMAVGVKNHGKSDLGVAVTGFAGPASYVGEPVGLVYVAVCNKDTVWVKRLDLSANADSREKIREHASLHVFDMIRRIVNGLAIFNSQRIPVYEVLEDMKSATDLSGTEYTPSIVKSSSKIVIHRNKDEQAENENTQEAEENLTFKQKAQRLLFSLIPLKTDERNIIIKKSVFLSAVALLLISITFVLSFFTGISSNKALYKNLEKLKDKEISQGAVYPRGYLKEFVNLYSKNSDIAGWIKIDGTDISYPVMQTDNNSYYLNHNFNGKKDRHGTPFVDMRNNIKELDGNTVIYGNNMKSDNQMFSQLKNYYAGKQPIMFYRHHPVIEFDTVYEKSKWKIFSVFTCNTDGTKGNIFEYDLINASNAMDFDSYIKQVQSRSIFDIPVDVDISDKLLTLSTDYYEFEGQRLIIMARRVRANETETVDVNAATYNNDKYTDNGANKSTVSIKFPSRSPNTSRNTSSTISFEPATPTSRPIANNTSKTSSTTSRNHVTSSITQFPSQPSVESDTSSENTSTEVNSEGSSSDVASNENTSSMDGSSQESESSSSQQEESTPQEPESSSLVSE